MLEIGHCDQNFGMLLEISETLQEKRLLIGTKPNEYLNFLPTLWHALILISQYIGLARIGMDPIKPLVRIFILDIDACIDIA